MSRRAAFAAALTAPLFALLAACGPSRPAAPPSADHPRAPSSDGDTDAEDTEDDKDDKDDDDTDARPAPPKPGTRPSHRPGARAAKTPCATDLAHCTPIGCAKKGTPHAIFNELKRRTTDAAGAAITRDTARAVTFEDLRALQAAADAALPDAKELTRSQRDRLVSLSVASGTLGEGTGVKLIGFIAPDHGTPSSGAHPGGVESVNCRLAKPEDRDVHIPIVARPEQPECEGVVVEPIPQTRAEHPSWTTGPMRQLAHQKKLVMFVGPLFWDNEHEVNPDCGHLKSGQPKRMSLWEIHPVTELYVCDSGACTANDHAGWRKVD